MSDREMRYQSDRIGIESIRAFIAYVETDKDVTSEDLVRIGSAVKSLGDWRFYIATYRGAQPSNPRRG